MNSIHNKRKLYYKRNLHKWLYEYVECTSTSIIVQRTVTTYEYNLLLVYDTRFKHNCNTYTSTMCNILNIRCTDSRKLILIEIMYCAPVFENLSHWLQARWKRLSNWESRRVWTCGRRRQTGAGGMRIISVERVLVGMWRPWLVPVSGDGWV